MSGWAIAITSAVVLLVFYLISLLLAFFLYTRRYGTQFDIGSLIVIFLCPWYYIGYFLVSHDDHCSSSKYSGTKYCKNSILSKKFGPSSNSGSNKSGAVKSNSSSSSSDSSSGSKFLGGCALTNFM